MPPDKMTADRQRDHNSYRRECVWGFITLFIMALGAVLHQTHHEFSAIRWLVFIMTLTHVATDVFAIVVLLMFVPFLIALRPASLIGLKKAMLQYRIHFPNIFMNFLWSSTIFFAGHHIFAEVTLATNIILNLILTLGCYLGPRWINVPA